MDPVMRVPGPQRGEPSGGCPTVLKEKVTHPEPQPGVVVFVNLHREDRVVRQKSSGRLPARVVTFSESVSTPCWSESERPDCRLCRR